MKRALACSLLWPLMVCAMQKEPVGPAASPSIVTAAIVTNDDRPIAQSTSRSDGTVECGPYVITLGSTNSNVPETTTVWYVVTKNTKQVVVGIKTIDYNKAFRRDLDEEHTLKLAVMPESNPDTKK